VCPLTAVLPRFSSVDSKYGLNWQSARCFFNDPNRKLRARAPDEDCMVDDVEPLNETFAGWLLFLKVTCVSCTIILSLQCGSPKKISVCTDSLMKAKIDTIDCCCNSDCT
jgi:hypothetical protein